MAKKKAVRLPFVVAPRLEPITEVFGSEESGKIEVIRRGYLTVAEKAFVSAALSEDTAIRDLRATAMDIARKTGKNQAEVLSDITKPESLPDYLEPYSKDILIAIGGLMDYQERRAIVAATCMLVYRVDRGWTIDDTLELHTDLRDALAALYEDEEMKNLEALENHYKVTRDDKVVGGDSDEGKS